MYRLPTIIENSPEQSVYPQTGQIRGNHEFQIYHVLYVTYGISLSYKLR